VLRRNRRTQNWQRAAIAAAVGATVALAAGAVLLRRARRSPLAEAKRTVRRAVEEPWRGNVDVIDELVATDYVGYDAAEAEPIRGPEGVKANIAKYKTGFPDGLVTVDHQIAEGDMVATRWTGRGTQTGEIAGLDPTGKQVTVAGLTISRLEDGKIAEEWTVWDTLGMLIQLGAVPEPARA
jgi:steroid delta-isomerase-like uncharacterized protein